MPRKLPPKRSAYDRAWEGNALYRIMGSLAFVALARGAFLLTHDKENPERRLLLSIKNNLSGVRTGLAFSLVPSPRSDLPMLAWETNLVNLTANDALAPVPPESGETRLEAVKKWLRATLADRPLWQETIERDAKGLGISIKLVLYVGDWDPSGLHMSEVDLPRRLLEYGASVEIVRVTLTHDHVANRGLPSLEASTKRQDPRWRWYVQRYGRWRTISWMESTRSIGSGASKWSGPSVSP